MRTGLIAGFAALVVAVIFIIQNAHAANISFLEEAIAGTTAPPAALASPGRCNRPAPSVVSSPCPEGTPRWRPAADRESLPGADSLSENRR
jgi:hypothetical protein